MECAPVPAFLILLLCQGHQELWGWHHILEDHGPQRRTILSHERRNLVPHLASINVGLCDMDALQTVIAIHRLKMLQGDDMQEG